METIAINYNVAKNANKICLKLSTKLYKLNEKIIFDERDKLLLSVGCLTLNEYFEKVSRLESASAASHMKIYHKMLSLKILNKLVFDTALYLPSFLDNRARLYLASLISPTFYKIFRYLYEFEKKKNFENLFESVFYKKIISYKWCVSDFNFSDFKSYLLIIFSLEIGKLFIKNEGKCFNKTEDIIKLGLQYMNTDVEFTRLKSGDAMYFSKIKKCVSELFDDTLDCNVIIFKDATASVLQNFGILLGYKEETLKFINLDGND